MMSDIAKGAGVVVGIVFSILALGLIMSWPVMMLWNYCLVPAVSGIKEIGWFQAWGLYVLCGFMFKRSSKD